MTTIEEDVIDEVFGAVIAVFQRLRPHAATADPRLSSAALSGRCLPLNSDTHRVYRPSHRHSHRHRHRGRRYRQQRQGAQ
jgi:hypothetical protein